VDGDASQAHKTKYLRIPLRKRMTSDLLGNLDDNPGAEQPPPADEPRS
jgi:hypothetical protein